MASALPGQLGPVRLLGWQRLLSVKVWCPCGRFCQSWQRPGITVSGFLRSSTVWWEKCKQVSSFAGVHFSLGPSNTHPHKHRHTHTKLREKHTQTLLLTHTHICLHTLEHTHTHSWTHTHTYLLTLSVSFSVSHIPFIFIFNMRVRQSAVYTLSLSWFLAAVPSLQSLFHSKQNKMKSNTDLIWLLQENLKHVVSKNSFSVSNFPSGPATEMKYHMSGVSETHILLKELETAVLLLSNKPCSGLHRPAAKCSDPHTLQWHQAIRISPILHMKHLSLRE